MTRQERVDAHNAAFPAGLFILNEKIYGMWQAGQNYRNKSKIYGAYPPRYLERVHSMFPEKKMLLHLFSGKVERGTWPQAHEYTMDINPDNGADFVGDAHELGSYNKGIALEAFDLVLADPPYSAKDAEQYGYKMVYRKKVLHECAKVLQPGGHLVWLDTVWPQYTKREFELAGLIGYVRSTNHRVRLVTILRRNDA